MVSSPITSWQIDVEKVETVADFIFLDPKITVDGDCSHKIKTLSPWKKNCANLDSVAETSLCQLRSVELKLWFFQ